MVVKKKRVKHSCWFFSYKIMWFELGWSLELNFLNGSTIGLQSHWTFSICCTSVYLISSLPRVLYILEGLSIVTRWMMETLAKELEEVYFMLYIVVSQASYSYYLIYECNMLHFGIYHVVEMLSLKARLLMLDLWCLENGSRTASKWVHIFPLMWHLLLFCLFVEIMTSITWF